MSTRRVRRRTRQRQDETKTDEEAEVETEFETETDPKQRQKTELLRKECQIRDGVPAQELRVAELGSRKWEPATSAKCHRQKPNLNQCLFYVIVSVFNRVPVYRLLHAKFGRLNGITFSFHVKCFHK